MWNVTDRAEALCHQWHTAPGLKNKTRPTCLHVSASSHRADRWHRALALSLLLLSAACREAPRDLGFITVAMPTAPNSLDPRYGTDDVSARAQQLIFSNLLTLDDRLKI